MIRLGQRFIQARRQKQVTVDQAAKALKIRVEFLQALESGEYRKLPSSAYAVGFVGNYAAYLGLPKNETIAMFRREFDEKMVFAVLPDEFTKPKEFKVKRFHFQQTLGVFVVILVAIMSYLAFQYRYAFLNPSLSLEQPTENQILHTTHIQVVGKTDPNMVVTVNTSAVVVDDHGNFSKALDVFEGKTVVIVSATNRFGKKTTIQRHITVSP